MVVKRIIYCIIICLTWISCIKNESAEIQDKKIEQLENRIDGLEKKIEKLESPQDPSLSEIDKKIDMLLKKRRSY